MTLIQGTAVVLFIFASVTAQARLATGSLVQTIACSETDSVKVTRLCLAKVEGQNEADFLIAKFEGEHSRIYRLVGKTGVARSRIGYLNYAGSRSYLREVGTVVSHQLIVNAAEYSTVEGGTTVGTVLIERDGLKLLTVTMEPRNGTHVKGSKFQAAP